MRDDIETSHLGIQIVDTPNFYDMESFNACEEHEYMMEVPDSCAEVHPSIVALPMEWDYEIPFGIVYAQKSSRVFARIIKIIDAIN